VLRERLRLGDASRLEANLLELDPADRLREQAVIANEYERAQQELNRLLGLPLRLPVALQASAIAGVIESVDLTLGEVVDPSRRIFTIVNLDAVWVRAAAYDRDVTSIRQGMPAIVRIQGVDGAALPGRVIQIGPGVDEKTRTLPIRIEVRNASAADRPDGHVLRPGMFVSAALEVGRRSSALVVRARKSSARSPR
jgi:multidrug efflux pump subunit AcrA (membrane-fusion protein)